MRRPLVGADALVDDSFRQAELMRRRRRRVPPPQSGFAGFRFPREVIVLAVRWYPRYGLSYRDVEELLAERDVTVDQELQSRLDALSAHGIPRDKIFSEKIGT